MPMNMTGTSASDDPVELQSGQRNNVSTYQSEDDDALVDEILENLKRGRAHRSEWRKRSEEDYDFFAGVQWSQEDDGKLREEGRPPVVFNRIVRTINAVSGVEVQNRQKVKFYPRNIDVNANNQGEPQQGQSPMTGMQQQPQQPQQPNPQTNDSGYAQMLNNAADWVRDQNDAEDEESESFQDCLICGEGWTETRMDYDDEPQGMIMKDRIDPLTMLVDPDSTKRNYIDARWVACVKDFTKKQVREMFPDLPSIDNAGTLWDSRDMLVHDETDEWKYINDYSDNLTKVNKISVVQYQYWRKEKVYIILTPDGNITTFTQDRYNKAKKVIEQLAVRIVKLDKKVYKQCFLVGRIIAEKRELGCQHFTFNAITGLRDRNRNIYFGLVALMKDPQRWANKWLSQIQYILNSNSKGGYMIETGAVQNMREFEDEVTKPNSVVELNPGGLAKIKEKQQAQYPDGIDRLLNYAIGAISDIPGVNLELIGMAGRDQPIGLEMTRKEAGITVLANFFDSLRRYRKLDGRVLSYFIREYIADGRLIRILGEQGMEYVPLLKSQVAFEYDVVIDDAPTSPNSKDKTFAILAQLLPMVMQAGIPVPKEILDYAPLPFDLVQKWKNEITQAEQPDPEQQAIQQQMQQIGMLLSQIQVAQAQADVEKTQSEVVKNMAAAEKDHSVGQEQSALAMQKFGMMQGAHELKSQEMSQKQQREDLKLMLDQYRKLLEVQLDSHMRNKVANAKIAGMNQPRMPLPSLAQIQ